MAKTKLPGVPSKASPRAVERAYQATSRFIAFQSRLSKGSAHSHVKRTNLRPVLAKDPQ